jgi:hypothetical protein
VLIAPSSALFCLTYVLLPVRAGFSAANNVKKDLSMPKPQVQVIENVVKLSTDEDFDLDATVDTLIKSEIPDTQREQLRDSLLTGDEKKAITLFEISNRVHEAISTKIMESMGGGMDSEWRVFFDTRTEVYKDFAIVHAPAGVFKIEYEIDELTYKVSVGEPSRVEIMFREVNEGEIVEEEEDESNPNAFSDLMKKNVDPRSLVKFVDGSDDRIQACAVLWGDEERKDLTGEFFSQDTEELEIIFDALKALPVLYQHAMDGELKADDVGLWYEAQLKLSDEYGEAIRKLINSKRLGTSTQTFPVARKVADNGHIERWPIVEITLTPTPAEHRLLTDHPVTEAKNVSDLKARYTEIGCDEDDISRAIKTLESMLTQGAEEARLRLNLQRQRLALSKLY